MSQCRDFEEALWEAAEGRPLAAEAEAHLQACASCRAAMQRLAEASRGFAALRAVAAPDPSAAVWGRVTRRQRRPMFMLAWAAGAAACVVATTFALRHEPAQRVPIAVQPVRRVAQAPPEPPAASQVEVPAPVQQRAPAEEIARPAEAGTGARKAAAGGRGRLVPTPQKTQATEERQEQQPEAPAQTQVAQAPLGGETTPVAAAVDDSCSEAAALAYRAIGRGLVARFFSSNGETG